ncbi:putative dimethylaniline monooxygenase [Lineolata rhizophorae]|uniref:Putative dimethylaniline monooxygenase n=1 Tax=Lineolata rhizophorae TaxID=578093 RepID=A0A6A6NNG5_9PEZI|nr:putative dimethylaniline monooxygenase [Lineolata rhizophorae]
MVNGMSSTDLIVIGAGLYGVQAARTYLEIHPNDNVIIFEKSHALGGVWSPERVYGAFWTQTPVGMAEFSDQPLKSVPKEKQYYGYFPASYVTEYLVDYVDRHSFAGTSLSSRIVFGAAVVNLRKEDADWIVSVQRDGHDQTWSSPKVIDATGATSIPNIPVLPGRSQFRALTIHHKEFGRSEILRNDKYKKIAVLGGAKSAADLSYAAAKAGKSVVWIIRKSGAGPAAFAPAKGGGLYKNSNESLYNRLVPNFLASYFAQENRLTRFLHNTNIGAKIFHLVWENIHRRAMRAANYDRSDGKSNGFHKLKPDTSIFWQNDSTGINQRPDFFDTIANNVHVFREDIERLSTDAIILADGTELDTDALIYATGWKQSHPYIDDTLASDLGLPVSLEWDSRPNSTQRWDKLDKEAESTILQRFPVLAEPPTVYPWRQTTTPYRLHRTILPIHDHSIAFIGRVMMGNHFRNAEAQSLWAVAALDGALELPSTEDMERDVAKTVSWCRKRYLSRGELGNWFYWDLIPYTDMLLEDLHLRSHRKSGLKDLLAPCVAKDLRGLIDEYKVKRHISQEVSGMD